MESQKGGPGTTPWARSSAFLAEELDQLYLGFCMQLPSSLQAAGRELPYRLRLAPTADIPFSEVFSHEVTLAAPALFAEAIPLAPPDQIRQAVLAHMLAVIEAFGTDRVEDGQVLASRDLLGVLEHLRGARDRALLRVAEGKLSPDSVLRLSAQADENTRRAIAEERSLLTQKTPSSFATYERVSLGKQSVGFPAAQVLAKVNGFNSEQLAFVDEILGSIWLGLQFDDDVVDWEDDLKRGGAWALNLAQHLLFQGKDLPETDMPKANLSLLAQRWVLDSQALEHMLRLAYRKYRAARRRAEALGARRLASWAKGREQRSLRTAELESNNAGYSVRARQLANWAAEVLS